MISIGGRERASHRARYIFSYTNPPYASNMSSYEYDTTMECRDSGVLSGILRSRGYYYFSFLFNYIILPLVFWTISICLRWCYCSRRTSVIVMLLVLLLLQCYAWPRPWVMGERRMLCVSYGWANGEQKQDASDVCTKYIPFAYTVMFE